MIKGFKFATIAVHEIKLILKLHPVQSQGMKKG